MLKNDFFVTYTDHNKSTMYSTFCCMWISVSYPLIITGITKNLHWVWQEILLFDPFSKRLNGTENLKKLAWLMTNLSRGCGLHDLTVCDWNYLFIYLLNMSGFFFNSRPAWTLNLEVDAKVHCEPGYWGDILELWFFFLVNCLSLICFPVKGFNFGCFTGLSNIVIHLWILTKDNTIQRIGVS